MCSWFAPTNLVITFETKGLGRFTQEEFEKLVERDSRGNVTLNLPAKSVLIANHQVKVHLCPSLNHLTWTITKNADICGLVVSPRPSFVLCSILLQPQFTQVRVVPYVLHEHAPGRIHCTEKVPEVGSDCRVGM